MRLLATVEPLYLTQKSVKLETSSKGQISATESFPGKRERLTELLLTAHQSVHRHKFFSLKFIFVCLLFKPLNINRPTNFGQVWISVCSSSCVHVSSTQVVYSMYYYTSCVYSMYISTITQVVYIICTCILLHILCIVCTYVLLHKLCIWYVHMNYSCAYIVAKLRYFMNMVLPIIGVSLTTVKLKKNLELWRDLVHIKFLHISLSS